MYTRHIFIHSSVDGLSGRFHHVGFLVCVAGLDPGPAASLLHLEVKQHALLLTGAETPRISASVPLPMLLPFTAQVAPLTHMLKSCPFLRPNSNMIFGNIFNASPQTFHGNLG